jgi:hypothetical protein
LLKTIILKKITINTSYQWTKSKKRAKLALSGERPEKLHDLLYSLGKK